MDATKARGSGSDKKIHSKESTEEKGKSPLMLAILMFGVPLALLIVFTLVRDALAR